MSGLDMDNIKFYAAVSADGGDIDLSNEQTSGVVERDLNNISNRSINRDCSLLKAICKK